MPAPKKNAPKDQTLTVRQTQAFMNKLRRASEDSGISQAKIIENGVKLELARLRDLGVLK